MQVSPAVKRRLPLPVNRNAVSDFISVVEDTGGLLVAVGRKRSVTRASVKKKWAS